MPWQQSLKLNTLNADFQSPTRNLTSLIHQSIVFILQRAEKSSEEQRAKSNTYLRERKPKEEDINTQKWERSVELEHRKLIHLYRTGDEDNDGKKKLYHKTVQIE